MTVKESPDELTLRVQEVGTWTSYINVDYIEMRGGVLLWLIMTGTPSVWRCAKHRRRRLGESYDA